MRESRGANEENIRSWFTSFDIWIRAACNNMIKQFKDVSVTLRFQFVVFAAAARGQSNWDSLRVQMTQQTFGP